MTKLNTTKCDGPDCQNEQNDLSPGLGYSYIMLEGQRYDFHSEACMIKWLVRRREDSTGEAI